MEQPEALPGGGGSGVGEGATLPEDGEHVKLDGEGGFDRAGGEQGEAGEEGEGGEEEEVEEEVEEEEEEDMTEERVEFLVTRPPV